MKKYCLNSIPDNGMQTIINCIFLCPFRQTPWSARKKEKSTKPIFLGHNPFYEAPSPKAFREFSLEVKREPKS
jgi:hypothetical protein